MLLAYLDSGSGSAVATVIALVFLLIVVAVVIAIVRFLLRRGRSRPGPVDPLDRINKLAALRDEGKITDEEYDAQKASILGPS